jgi:hypothetical protein
MGGSDVMWTKLNRQFSSAASSFIFTNIRAAPALLSIMPGLWRL